VRILRKYLAVAAWLCLGAVVLQWAALRLVGEAWWLTTLYLYAPFALLLLPVAAISLALLIVGPRRLLLTQAVAAALVLFPTMGLTISLPNSPTPGAPNLRVLAFNVDSGWLSVPDMVEEIRTTRPDLILLVESTAAVDRAVADAFPGFAAFTSTQFGVISRYPVVDLLEPPQLKHDGVDRSPRFIRVTVDTPLGPLDVFVVHPISPRDAVESVRGDGLLVGLRTGGVFRGKHSDVGKNTHLRLLQVQAIAALAAASPRPVIIAGDTNLPGPSRILANNLAAWRDGFDSVGLGFGYTYPLGRRWPWMRIDRILASSGLRFLRFGTGRGRGSDHHCVWADIERPGASPR
jgi:endonuclease/exonuclease/phosphatase (EEP) superfamily protein YafD